jgi:hypothetical protein
MWIEFKNYQEKAIVKLKQEVNDLLDADGQLKELMSKRELEKFNKWAFGSTMSPHGYYKWDVESFLKLTHFNF